MRNWRTEAIERVRDLINEGELAEDAVREVMRDYQREINNDVELSLLRSLADQFKKEWAEPPAEMEQLRFNLQGHEIAVPDTPVRYVDGDGQVRYKPARFSTAEERLASIEARGQHHQSWVQRCEGEHRREVEQIELLISLGVDVTKPHDQLRHASTICWRCGLGWREGDPFEKGHSDRPASQGGVRIEWEHRSCNRSAKDNPVNPAPPTIDDEEAA